MESELITIFSEHREPIGVATRENVHRYGYWHEVFHCWFVSKVDNVDYIYLQLRSECKKDFPNLLDITAAGHLMSTETVEDGIREVKEELGVDVAYDELISLGVVAYEAAFGPLIDKEYAHVFVHRFTGTLEEFTLQLEEVAGIFAARFDDFYDLWLNKKSEIELEGFVLNDKGIKVEMKKTVRKEQFVPHNEAYQHAVVNGIKEVLEDDGN